MCVKTGADKTNYATSLLRTFSERCSNSRMFLVYLLLSLSVTSGIPRERACSLVRSEVGMHTMSLSSPDFSYTVREGKRKEREREREEKRERER